MITLTIDSRTVAVPDGTTILEAAKGAGIRIPTLCHVDGLEPSSSCFICAVQIEGRRTLSPSCAMPVSEGMVVHTRTADVTKARKLAIELLLSDHAGECVAPCAARCPAGLDIPGFVYEIASQDYRRSLEIINRKLALPGSLGRVCPRLCEQECRRCEHDQGLAIGALHRYPADLDWKGRHRYTPQRPPSSGKSVAIIGAGPAGISAAFFLLQNGHACTLYDAAEHPGGMLRYGIPAYRLPKDALDAEIDIIRLLGAQFRMNTCWGQDFTLADLRTSHDAVFIAIGAQHAQGLGGEGEDLALRGIEFLALNAKGNPPELGSDVVVIGGGNTAMDCARTAARLNGARVRVLYRRTRREMPCLMEEVEGAETEGVQMDFLVAPIRLEQAAPGGLQLTCQRMQLGEPDKSGRRRPVAIPGSEFTLECSTVIAATGQSVERDLAEKEGIRVSGWGIAADPHTLATNIAGVFAGGDAVLGADLAVRAVAAGRVAAASIHQFLTGVPVTGEPEMHDIAFRPIDDAERAEVFRSIENAARVRMAEIPHHQRLTTFDEIELGLNEEEAQRESRRCMSCGCRKSDCCRIRTLSAEYAADPYHFAGARRRFAQDDSHPDIIYEPGKCILCGACVKIAAEANEPVGVKMEGRGFAVAVAAPFGRAIA
ncbi:MAG: FAD-dependent oxidoreductase, partial [Acidobacteria bacterium]|nr:FAD-dependent oxidoreductase [Acidobacteriota bacterium]